MSAMNQLEEQDVRDKVREGYGAIARQETGANSCCGPTSCCSADGATDAGQLARAIGYSEAELQALPAGANMGLSCGNPVAIASLREGEVVVDLGSGGGFDVFIAGRRVGASGRAIGVDMTPDMPAKARRNVADYEQRTGLQNVEFRLGEIENLPLANGIADVVISNCVINLSPNKPQVFREIARVLKPGGRVAVSDMALLQPLPDAVRGSVEALIGCVAGASTVEEIHAMLTANCLSEINLEAKPDYVDSLVAWNDPLYLELARQLPAGTKVSDYVVSLNISAKKPIGRCC